MIISDMIDFIKGIYTAQRQPMFPQNKCYLLYMQVYSTWAWNMLQKYTQFDFFQYLVFFVANISLGRLNLKKPVNHTNLHSKTFYNNAIYKTRQGIWHAGHIWKRRVKQYEKPGDTGYYSKYPRNVSKWIVILIYYIDYM